jgi:hypothetical protein
MSNKSGGYKAIRDGLILVGAYHFLLAIAWLLGAAAIVVYAIIPPMSNVRAELPQDLFLPIIGLIAGLLMAILYGTVGSGLVQVKNWARMAAVFLGMFGIGGGLLGIVGLLAGSINALAPDWVRIATIGIAGSCGFFVTTVIDLLVLVFLLNRRVQALFYGEEWVEPAPPQPMMQAAMAQPAVYQAPPPQAPPPEQPQAPIT